MNESRSIVLVFIGALMISSTGSAKIPSGNIALLIDSGARIESSPGSLLPIAIERELREKGFTGGLRRISAADIIPGDGESLIRLTVVKSTWETQKAFSIPYLLNRYKKIYVLSVFVEIPNAKNKAFSRTITANESSKVEAQFIQNDRYDPDLLLDQTQRINLEDKACRKLARLLTGLISRNLE